MLNFIIYIITYLLGYLIKLIDNPVVTVVSCVGLIIFAVIVVIVQVKGFTNKTFECLVCGKDFKPKLYKLMFFKWRMPKKYRVYKKINEKTYEKLIYKCPECNNRECVVK